MGEYIGMEIDYNIFQAYRLLIDVPTCQRIPHCVAVSPNVAAKSEGQNADRRFLMES